jgi:Flp pilus assembly protein TadG
MGHEQACASERGTVTLWVLGLCVCVLVLGGLALDVWRGIHVRRELAAAADAAALAGASGLEEASLRAGGATLDERRVRELVAVSLASTSAAPRIEAATVEVIDGVRVVVTLRARVPLMLPAVLLDAEPLVVEVRAVAAPERRA